MKIERFPKTNEIHSLMVVSVMALFSTLGSHEGNIDDITSRDTLLPYFQLFFRMFDIDPTNNVQLFIVECLCIQ
jgi:hypothetical protein